MARNTTLANLVTMLQAQLGQAITASPANLAQLQSLLSAKQQWLASEYDWPFLEDRFDTPIPPQSRYLSFPTIDNEGLTLAMNMERPYRVEVFWNNLWSPVEYGIGSAEFNYLNSDQPGQIQDPIQRWRWSEEGQFEIWPINSTSTVIRFTGQRALDGLVNSTDTADLDDQLIVLAVAAELLARNKQQDAQNKQALFMERLRAVRASYPGRPKGLILGGGCSREEKKRLVSVGVSKN